MVRNELMTTESKKQTWFDVDRAGLAKLLKRRGIEFAVFELIQNAWDEAGVTRVDVNLKPASSGYAMLTVSDDAPEGFKDLRHAYTLFAESAKKSNAEQRGRFNIGEKLVLALCDYASITTTKGTVFFDSNGTRSETAADHTEIGSVFNAKIKMTRKEVEQVTREVRKLMPPVEIETIFNGQRIETRCVAHVIEAILPTEIADSDGVLRRTKRKTAIRCSKPLDDETAMIYEMGIPVVEHDCAWHCDIQQKVPLTLDRENVTTRFLRYLRTAVFNETHEDLTTEDVNHEWAQTAIESGHAEPEAVKDYMTKRFGELRASYDMSDREANNQAVAQGYTIVHGSMLSKAAWENVRDAEAITPAGQIFPTHPDSGAAFAEAEKTPAMCRVAEYTCRLAELLLGVPVEVQFGEQSSREAACFGACVLQFNVRNLGKDWFDLDRNRLAIDDLIIHEFGHHYASNHLSEAYNDALSRLAAKAMKLGREGRLPK
jgi:Histidine kinase-, DNA gyrase B-, and HSP90-like ATPase